MCGLQEVQVESKFQMKVRKKKVLENVDSCSSLIANDCNLLIVSKVPTKFCSSGKMWKHKNCSAQGHRFVHISINIGFLFYLVFFFFLFNPRPKQESILPLEAAINLKCCDPCRMWLQPAFTQYSSRGGTRGVRGAFTLI